MIIICFTKEFNQIKKQEQRPSRETRPEHNPATCCSECIRKWHKMQSGKELSQVQQDYLVDVIMTWIQREMERQGHII